MADDKKNTKSGPGQPEARKTNPWIPVAIVAVIVALIAVMAAIGNESGTPATDQAASGTTQSGTGAQADVDVSWITLDTTPNDVAAKTGISPKMLQQVLGVEEAEMAKPFKDIGGQEVLDTAASLVVQFGGQGGAMGGGSTEAPAGMGGTTSP